MTNKFILVDVDDTILKWREAFLNHVGSLGYEVLPAGYDEYCVSAELGIPSEESDKLVLEFNSNWKFGTLDAYTDALDIIPYLATQGYQFIAITSCTKNEFSIALRKANLYNVFGDIFDEVHCLEIGESKDLYLSRYEPTYWVEDHPGHAASGVEYGHHSFLLNRPWTINGKTPDGVVRCNNWYEIGKVILSEGEK